jgi:hypothetical protein
VEILPKYAIDPYQQFPYTSGKNASDIALTWFGDEARCWRASGGARSFTVPIATRGGCNGKVHSAEFAWLPAVIGRR